MWDEVISVFVPNHLRIFWYDFDLLIYHEIIYSPNIVLRGEVLFFRGRLNLHWSSSWTWLLVTSFTKKGIGLKGWKTLLITIVTTEVTIDNPASMSLSDMSMRHSVIYHAALDQNKQTHANTCGQIPVGACGGRWEIWGQCLGCVSWQRWAGWKCLHQSLNPWIILNVVELYWSIQIAIIARPSTENAHDAIYLSRSELEMFMFDIKLANHIPPKLRPVFWLVQQCVRFQCTFGFLGGKVNKK